MEINPARSPDNEPTRDHHTSRHCGCSLGSLFSKIVFEGLKLERRVLILIWYRYNMFVHGAMYILTTSRLDVIDCEMTPVGRPNNSVSI